MLRIIQTTIWLIVFSEDVESSLLGRFTSGLLESLQLSLKLRLVPDLSIYKSLWDFTMDNF